MKIASFNVNSIRSRLSLVTEWLTGTQVDVLCVQETKVQDKDFPAEAFEKIGYNYAFKGQKSYNGVAIFSKHAIEKVQFGFVAEPKDEPRLIRADIKDISIVNTYVPQGYEVESEKFEYKLEWFKRLKDYFKKNFKPTEQLVWVGDLNVAPLLIDVYDPAGLQGHVCFNQQVRQALDNVIKWGLVDVFRKHHTEAGLYTFWDYRMPNGFKRNLGWRLDHIMATKPLAEKCVDCYVEKELRAAEKPSDHAPIIAEFDW